MPPTDNHMQPSYTYINLIEMIGSKAMLRTILVVTTTLVSPQGFVAKVKDCYFSPYRRPPCRSSVFAFDKRFWDRGCKACHNPHDFAESARLYLEAIGIFIINSRLIVNADRSMVIRVRHVHPVDIVIYLKTPGEYDSLTYDGRNDDW